VVAAGEGKRAGVRLPKQFLKVGGRSLLEHSLHRLAAHPFIEEIVAVVPAARVRGLAGLRRAVPSLSAIVAGGARRQDSVRRGLEALSHRRTGIVLVHDAARPAVPREVIDAVVASARRNGSGVPALTPPDTVKEVTRRGRVVRTLRRAGLRLAQTPQAFRIRWLREAFSLAAEQGLEETDDAALVEAAGFPVRVVEGSPLNFKVTTAEDVERIRVILGG
jgi:2-C-methyl-D-erythritol 4-phosphate cytidylyltransferase/2-C-methyl-D-erythritol 2,4-cyclodiphosphate synthase